jgi:hypothetical protein
MAVSGSAAVSHLFPCLPFSVRQQAFAEETVWSLGDFSAVALWLPPGTDADGDAIVAVLIDSVAPAQHEDTFSILAKWTKGS